MITIGVDSGNLNTKAVVLKDGEILVRVKQPTGFAADEAAREILHMALQKAGLRQEDIDCIAATGVGRQIVYFAQSVINEVGSVAKGVQAVKAGVSIVVDIGAEGCRAIKLDGNGKVVKYEVNDKCASGAGTFVETMARTLQISIEDIGAYSLRHTKVLPMNAQCVVFAESEVISLIHRQETLEDIAYGIHVGIANRIAALLRRLGIVPGIMIVGGPGRNQGLVQCMEEVFKTRVAVPDHPEYISALGAAIFAGESRTDGGNHE
jgi:benzoyl-CoA reductase subunit D